MLINDANDAQQKQISSEPNTENINSLDDVENKLKDLSIKKDDMFQSEIHISTKIEMDDKIEPN